MVGGGSKKLRRQNQVAIMIVIVRLLRDRGFQELRDPQLQRENLALPGSLPYLLSEKGAQFVCVLHQRELQAGTALKSITM